MATWQTLGALRTVLARELETINEYERLAAAEADPEVAALFRHLADEEKEHVVEVYAALAEKDAAQKNLESTPHAVAIREHRLGDLGAKAAPPQPAGPAPAAPTRFGGTLTVGSLIQR